jgi:PAS domain S-box-containing protein
LEDAQFYQNQNEVQRLLEQRKRALQLNFVGMAGAALFAFIYLSGFAGLGGAGILTFEGMRFAGVINTVAFALSVTFFLLNWLAAKFRPESMLIVYRVSLIIGIYFLLFHSVAHLHNEGTHSSIFFGWFMVVVMVAAWFLSSRNFFVFIVLALASVAGVIVFEAVGILPYAPLLVAGADLKPLFTNWRIASATYLLGITWLTVAVIILRYFRIGMENANERLEAKVAERTKDLSEAEDRYRTVADFTYDWEVWFLPGGKIGYVSPSCERISGYTPAEFIACPDLFQQIIEPEHQYLWHDHEQAQEQDARSMRVRIRRKDGEIRWIEHYCRQVDDAKGKFNGHRASNRDITERMLVEEKLVTTEERERKRIAQDLHDGVCQLLIGTKIGMAVFRKTLLESEHKEKIDSWIEAISKATEQTRKIVYDMNSPVLQTLGLEAAIEDHLNEIEDKFGLATSLFVTGKRLELNSFRQSSVFRFVRELLINAVKHASAQSLEVFLAYAPNSLSIAVCDDGIGFDPIEAGKSTGRQLGLGLKNLQDQVARLKGTFEVKSTPGGGAKITLTLPFAEALLEEYSTANQTGVTENTLLEESFANVLESLSSFITIIDRDCKIKYINHPVPGLSMDQVIGSSVFNFIERAFHDEAGRSFQAVLETGKHHSFCSQAPGPHGTIAWYENQLAPIFLGDEVQSISIHGLDITINKAAEAELSEYKKSLE